MLIISQDQDMIVNMDNVTSIALTSNGKEVSCFYSFLDDTQPREPWRDVLGKYSTQEQARFVLKELIGVTKRGYTYQMPKDQCIPDGPF